MRYVVLGMMAVLSWVYLIGLPRDASSARELAAMAESRLASPSPPVAREWRRTVNGWEAATNWQTYPRECAAPFHPLILAAAQLATALAAIFAADIAAFQRTSKQNRPPAESVADSTYKPSPIVPIG